MIKRPAFRSGFQIWLLPLLGVGLVALLAFTTRSDRAADHNVTLASEIVASSAVADTSNPVTIVELDSRVHVDATDYGNARHIVAGRTGALILTYVDLDNNASKIVTAHSNDEGRTWTRHSTPLGPGTLRPALAYDPVNDKLHMLYHANGSDERSDACYRRYAIARANGGRIQRLVLEGDLVLHARNSSRGTLLWTPDGGPHGAIVAAWTAFDGATRRDIRITMRALSNDAADFRASSWTSPDGARDTVPDAKDTLVAVDVVGIETSTPVPFSYQGQFHRLGLAGLVQRQSGSGPNARDLYLVFTLIGAPDASWKWSKAKWDPDAARWSGQRDWSKPQPVKTGNFDRGRIEKELTLSTLYDEKNDIVWFAAAHYVPGTGKSAGHDTVSLFSLGPDDALGRPHEVYAARDETARHPMTSLAIDDAGGKNTLYIAYVTGHGANFDGHIWLRSFTPELGLGPPTTLFAGVPSNYPSLLERSLNGRLHAIFRSQPGDYTVQHATFEIPQISTVPPPN